MNLTLGVVIANAFCLYQGFSEMSNRGPVFLRVLKLKCDDTSEDFFAVFDWVFF